MSEPSASARSRPFGQPEYPDARIRPSFPIDGYLYKFTVLLPIIQQGNAIFAASDEESLVQLLEADFGGCTSLAHETHPLLKGSYFSQDKQTRIIDYHTSCIVYTKYDEHAKTYFTELGLNLSRFSRIEIAKRLRSRGISYEGEEQILVEMVTVDVLPTHTPLNKSYEPLADLVRQLPNTRQALPLTFVELEDVLGFALPDEAHSQGFWDDIGTDCLQGTGFCAALQASTSTVLFSRD